MEKSVLIVDAMTETAIYVKSSLVKKGYKCLTSSSGQDAILKLKQHPEIELILVDISLPDFTASQFMERVGQTSFKRKPHVCFLLGRHRTGDPSMAIPQGASEFISKPVDAAQLRQKVEDLIGKPPVLPHRKFILNAPVFMVDSPIQPELVLASVSSNFLEIRSTARLQPLFLFKIRCDQLGHLLAIDNHFMIKVTTSEKQRSGLWISICELQGPKIVVSDEGLLTKSA